jgi:hypothetical protein
MLFPEVKEVSLEAPKGEYKAGNELDVETRIRQRSTNIQTDFAMVISFLEGIVYRSRIVITLGCT